EVPRVNATRLREGRGEETTLMVRRRVAAARAAQHTRLQRLGFARNSDLPGTVLRRELALPKSTTASADRQLERGHLTVRGLHRVLRLAWTISDLSGQETPRPADVDVALQLRQHAQGGIA